MKEELYYILPKKIVDEILGVFNKFILINQDKELITHSKSSINAIESIVKEAKLIDLSDEAIERRFDNYFKQLNEKNKYEDNYTNEVKSYRDYKAALTDLKQKL
jgi:predicted ATPase with chaperone activity